MVHASMDAENKHPLEEYTSRRERWRGEQAALQRLFIRIGNWRLVLGISEALLASTLR